MRAPTVMIVDDHPLVLQGMAQALESEGFCVAGTASGGLEALSLCKAKGLPDLVICDIRMNGLDGFGTLVKLRRTFPGVRVLFLAGMPLRDEVARAKAEGAVGYVPKSLPWKQLVAAIRRALTGSGFVDCEVPMKRADVLSPRELDVLKCLNLGKSQDETAVILGIGKETVKTYVRTLKEKLDASSSAGAVGRAYELGILRAAFALSCSLAAVFR